MAKGMFNIVCETKGSTAHIRIIGEIGWDTDSSKFRADVDTAVSQGATEAYLYLHGPGGSCIEAAEIVNIVTSSFKRVSGEGGALVASAYTYIAAHCETFVMPSNGLFMIHKPSGGAYGTSGDLQSYLKVLKDIETEYYNTLKSKAANIEEFDNKWSSGDWWMTSAEAKENGFITGVRERQIVDKQTAAMISACGCPQNMIPIFNENDNMEKELIEARQLLELSDSAGWQNVLGKVKEMAALNKELSGEKDKSMKLQERLDAIEQAEKTANAAEAKDLLEAAFRDGRLNDDEKHETRKAWEDLFNSNHQNAKKMLGALPARQSVRDRVGSSDKKSNVWAERQKEIEEANRGK